MCIPSIDSRLIDKTTYNISNKTYIKSKIGGEIKIIGLIFLKILLVHFID